MGLFDRFPWVNTHDLNLDWIIQKMKEWGADAAANVAKAETAATNAATAAANAATTAEPYALRAEAAADRAETAKSSAETAQTNATSAAKKALSSAGKAQNSESNAGASATAAAQSATAAAQSAEEAKTATKWPYDGVYNGYLYKRLDAVDQYTTTNMEFLTAPQENGVLYRVSGRIPKRASFNDATTKDYHYEKILKMIGSVSGNDINFSDSFAPSIPGLVIAEAETVGMVLFQTGNESFYKYTSLPLVNLDSNVRFTIDSDGLTIPDDMVANITCKLQNESISVSNVTAYLYVRMKYTF